MKERIYPKIHIYLFQIIYIYMSSNWYMSASYSIKPELVKSTGGRIHRTSERTVIRVYAHKNKLLWRGILMENEEKMFNWKWLSGLMQQLPVCELRLISSEVARVKSSNEAMIRDRQDVTHYLRMSGGFPERIFRFKIEIKFRPVPCMDPRLKKSVVELLPSMKWSMKQMKNSLSTTSRLI